MNTIESFFCIGMNTKIIYPNMRRPHKVDEISHMILILLKATKFCELLTLLLTGTTQDKSKVKILRNFVAFSEYMNFKKTHLETYKTKQIKCPIIEGKQSEN